MVSNWDLRLFPLNLKFLKFKQTAQTLIRPRRTLCLNWDCTVWQCPKYPSPGFTDNPLSKALWRHNDKNSAVTWISFDYNWSMIIMQTTAIRKFWRLYTMDRMWTIDPNMVQWRTYNENTTDILYQYFLQRQLLHQNQNRGIAVIAIINNLHRLRIPQ